MEIEVIEAPVADTAEQTEVKYYDAGKDQRFEFVVTEGNAKYDTAHVFGPIGDERWMQFLRDQKVRGNGEKIESNEVEAIDGLWNDLIRSVENIDTDGRALHEVIDYAEKKDALETYIAVAAFDPETAASGPRRPGMVQARTVITEAYQDGAVLQQFHTLRKKTLEDIKRYESILRRRLKQENVRGLRRSAEITFVPQDDKLAKLYDDMKIEVKGFAVPYNFQDNGTDGIPMRFKVAVVHHVFASDLDEKK